MLTVERITERDAWLPLRDVWNGLLDSSASASIALTWEWLTTWWDVFGADRDLFVLVVRDADAVVAIAPLLRRAVRQFGFTFRRLELLGTGEDTADEICSPYPDFIVRRGAEGPALHAIVAYLRANSADWDEIVLSAVWAESPAQTAFAAACGACGVRCCSIVPESAHYLPLPATYESLLAGLSRPLRQKIRRERREIEAEGGNLRIVSSASDFEANFDILVRLHQERWTARGEKGVFASERFTRFHRSLGPGLLDRGWLKLFILSVADTPVSALYTFIYNHRVFYYQSGLAVGACSIASPGTVNLSYGFEHAISQQCTEWDFLKGDDAYKSRWHLQTRPLASVRAAESRPKESVYQFLAESMDTLRRVRALGHTGSAKEDQPSHS